MAFKTELEHHLGKAVKRVVKERKKREEQEKLNKERKQSAKFYITALDSTPNLTNASDPDELS